MSDSSSRRWTLAVTSVAFFMVALDALVVTTALPVIGRDLHAGIATLQWTVNAYGLACAAGIITAAALGDRYGRRRVFSAGLAVFTLASAGCALAPGVGWLLAARAVLGVAVATAVFTATGGLGTAVAFTAGLGPALLVAAGLSLLGALTALALRRRTTLGTASATTPIPDLADATMR